MIVGGDSYIRLQLANALKELGVEVDNQFICLDYPGLSAMLKAREYPKRARVLVNFEPKVIQPFAYLRIWNSLFGTRIQVGNVSQGIPWPHFVSTRSLTISARKNRAVIIQADKISMIKGELYSLRRKIIDRGPVDFFGPGWEFNNRKRVKAFALELARGLASSSLSLRGASSFFRKRSEISRGVADKIATFSEYKVALIIENSMDTWTEKLPDALASGCIPIYVGPDLPAEFFDPKTFIRALPTISSISEALSSALSLDHATYLQENRNSIGHHLDALNASLSFREIADRIRAST